MHASSTISMQRCFWSVSVESQIHALWNSALGKSWPIPSRTLSTILGLERTDDHHCKLGVWKGSSLIGIAVAEILSDDAAALVLLLVDPQHQRTGIGSRLLDQLSLDLKEASRTSLSLGAGATRLLWHGVPSSLPHAVAFFKKKKFELNETSFDLVQDISNFNVPNNLRDHPREKGYLIELATEEVATGLLRLESDQFPEWHHYYEAAVSKGEFRNILVARRDKQILGAVLLSIAPECPGGHWGDLVGPNVGAFGILGVDAAHREKGIGLTLAAFATEALRLRGADTCFVHWTWLKDWYGKIGFTVWGEYLMGTCKLTVAQNS